MRNPMRRSKAIGDRGKWTEDQVDTMFSKLNKSRYDFAYHRLPDARAAGGRLKAQPADFLVSCGRMRFLEVKETQHDYRLAKDKVAQIAVLRKHRMAGTQFGVLVYHSEIEKWRFAPDDFFGVEGLPASWDLRDLPTFDTAIEAFTSSGWLSG